MIDHSLIFLFILVLINLNHAQDNKSSIKYLGQIASEEDIKIEKSMFSAISDYILGKEVVMFQKPISLLVNSDKDIWVLDQGINCIMNLEMKKYFYTLDCEKNNFQSLVGICQINSETIVFSDSHLGNLFYFNKHDPEIHILSESLELNKPTGLAFNRITKYIWVVETGKHRVLLLTSTGNLKQIIGSRGTNQEQFNFPTFLWIDKQGTVYIVDSMNFRVQIFDRNGSFVSMFGKAGDASGYFARPKGIATDSYGNIYIVDGLFNTVQIFDKEGTFLYNFGQKGSGPSEFMLPSGIYIDDNNHIYVADSYNARIQIFELVRETTVENNIKN